MSSKTNSQTTSDLPPGIRCVGYADYEYRVNGLVLRVEREDKGWRWYCPTTGANGTEINDGLYRTKREAKAGALVYAKATGGAQ